jgi:hypothetical protein
VATLGILACLSNVADAIGRAVWIEPRIVPYHLRPTKAGRRDTEDHLGLDELLTMIGMATGLDGPYLDGSQEWVADNSEGVPSVRLVAGTVNQDHNWVAWIDHVLTWPGDDDIESTGDPWESMMVNVAGPDLPAVEDDGWYPPHHRLPRPPAVSVHLADDREDLIDCVRSVRFINDTLLIGYRWRGRDITCRTWLPVEGRRQVRQKWAATT